MKYYVHNLDPIAFEIFGMPFPWYWLVYFAGYFWIFFGLRHLAKKELLSAKFEIFQNYLFYGFLILLLSGKAFYILFYNLDYYLSNPSDIFSIWKGGMSFHGALLGCAAWTIFYSRKHKKNFWIFSDPLCTLTPLVLFFGRIANFVNGELAGRQTDVTWAVIFPKLYDQSPRHPSQIYEAFLEGLLLFLILWFGKSRLSKPGVQSAIFLFGYGLARFVIEFFRLPDPQIGYFFEYFSIGQFYCLIMVAAGLVIFKRASMRKSL